MDSRILDNAGIVYKLKWRASVKLLRTLRKAKGFFEAQHAAQWKRHMNLMRFGENVTDKNLDVKRPGA